MVERNRTYRRIQRRRVINRKKRIIKGQNNYWHYKNEGELSKGKIHCSCWMCRSKSYDRAKIQDVRNYENIYEQMFDLYNRNNSNINRLERKMKTD